MRRKEKDSGMSRFEEIYRHPIETSLLLPTRERDCLRFGLDLKNMAAKAGGAGDEFTYLAFFILGEFMFSRWMAMTDDPEPQQPHLQLDEK